MESDDESAWRQYVEAHPDATFYHRLGWKRVIEASFGHRTYYFMAHDHERIVGVLPVVHLRSFVFGSIQCSMPFMGCGGVLADNPEAEAALIDTARELLATSGADYLELRSSKRLAADLPTKTHKICMALDLAPGPDVLWERFASKHRREVRKALACDLEIRFGGEELLDDCFAVLSVGWRNLGTPLYSKSFFRKVLRVFGEAVEIVLVTHQGRPVATAFDGFFRQTVEGMWTYATRAPFAYANYYLYWQLIQRACERGFTTYHLGRSSVDSTGVAYKRKWLAKPLQLYWQYLLGQAKTVPDLSVDNPKYGTYISLWKKLPVPVARRLGPMIAGNIP
jgi:FemAB-related protein (PEP-CTERM system-associated)